MRIGPMRHRVTIKTPVEVQNSRTGEVGTEYATLAPVWCERRDIGGTEQWRGRALTPGTNVLIRMRHRTDVTTQEIVEDGTETLEILSVLDMTGRDRELHLDCRVRP